MKPTTTLLFTAITAASLFAGAIQAQSSDRLPVSELKPLLKLAIERGEARGVLTGESAAYMKQKFGTTAALEIDVPLPRATAVLSSTLAIIAPTRPRECQ